MQEATGEEEETVAEVIVVAGFWKLLAILYEKSC
jgi:hypothetical protein